MSRLGWAVARSALISNSHRQLVLRAVAGGRFRDSWISQQVSMVQPEEVSMGPGCYINEGVFLDAYVSLGDNVYLGPRAMLVTGSHRIGGPELRAGPGAPSAIRVGDGCWIGAGAMILPGVTVGAGCVVAAGAVVTRDCEPNGLYAGVPASRRKELPTAPEGVDRG